MLVAHAETFDRPGEHTGAAVVTPDGVRWTLGNMMARSTSGYYGFVTWTYAITAISTEWTRDDEGRRRKVRSDCEASFSNEERGVWTIDTFEGEWQVLAALA